MAYITGIERGLLDDDPDALGQVFRWIAMTLASPRFWSLRSQWPDLSQEVMVRLIFSLREARYDGSRDLRTYVQGIARHVAIQALDGHVRESRFALRDSAGGGQTQDPERMMTHRQIVHRVLDQATPDCRRLIRAYFYEGCTYEEIAASMNVPVGTVKSRLFRCMESAYLFLEGTLRPGNSTTPSRNKTKTEVSD